MRDERQRQKSGCLPAIAAIAIGFALAMLPSFVNSPLAWADVELTVESGTRSPAISAKQLGLVAMDETNGTTQAVAEANSAILNAYFDTGWQTQGLTIYFAGKGYALWNTIDIDKEGFSLIGVGVGDTRAEAEYGTRGGAVTRLVCINPSLDVLVNYTGAYIHVQDVMLQGWYHATNGATLKAATSSFCDVGWFQGPQNDGKGCGKLYGRLVFSCFTTAIQFGDEFAGDNADQWCIDSLRTLDCGTGLHIICHQSVGHLVDQYEGTRTGVMCYAEHGGKILGGQWTAENAAPTVFRVRAQDFNSNLLELEHLYMDGSIGSTQSTILQMDAVVPDGTDGIADNDDDEDPASVWLKLGALHIATPVTLPPLIQVRDYSRVHINSGEQLFDRMVQVIGGNSSFMNEVVVRDARFRSGETPVDFLIGTGSGYARVVVENCGNVGNQPFADSYRYWNNGSLSTYNPLSP